MRFFSIDALMLKSFGLESYQIREVLTVERNLALESIIVTEAADLVGVSGFERAEGRAAGGSGVK